MLREFGDIELVSRKIDIHFDDAFNIWKLNKLKDKIEHSLEKLRLCKKYLLKSVNSFVTSKPTIISYINN